MSSLVRFALLILENVQAEIKRVIQPHDWNLNYVEHQMCIDYLDK